MVVTGAPRAGVTVTCDSNLLRENVEANARWMAVRRSAVTGRVSSPRSAKHAARSWIKHHTELMQLCSR